MACDTIPGVLQANPGLATAGTHDGQYMWFRPAIVPISMVVTIIRAFAGSTYTGPRLGETLLRFAPRTRHDRRRLFLIDWEVAAAEPRL